MKDDEYEIFLKMSKRKSDEEVKDGKALKPEDLNMMMYEDVVSPSYFDKDDKRRDRSDSRER
jgi:hypothetical protein